jgi:hypothetical protein
MLNWAVPLCLVTLTLQFTSTILFSDLRLGLLPGPSRTTVLAADFVYLEVDIPATNVTPAFSIAAQGAIPGGGNMWTNRPSFPTFAEYAEPPPQNLPEHVSDTGVRLRALLPYNDAQSRETLSNYTGKAMVLDSRVSCQSPHLSNLTFDSVHLSDSVDPTSDYFWVISGIVSTNATAPQMQPSKPLPFHCYFAKDEETSLCQLGSNFSMQSQFSSDTVNTQRIGASFLVLTPINPAVIENDTISYVQRAEWSVIYASDEPFLAASLCISPWDSAVLHVGIGADSNRTEPTSSWISYYLTSVDPGSFNTTYAEKQLVIPQLSGNTSVPDVRPVMRMAKPESTIPAPGDIFPYPQRSFLQPDAAVGMTILIQNTSSTANYTVMLSNYVPINNMVPNDCAVADPGLSSLFANIIANNASLAEALSAVITVLSSMAYYE